MLNPSFDQLLEIFQMCHLRFYLKLQKSVYMPAFTGSTIHGMLGHALRKYAPQAEKICFRQYQNQQSKPYAIVANPQRKTRWHKGEIFSFDIKLFGEVSSISQQVIDAIRLFGQSDGIGSNVDNKKAKYQLYSIASVRGSQQYLGEHRFSLRQHFDAVFKSNINKNAEVALQLNSLLRIKQHDQNFTKAPNLLLILQNISRRWQILTKYWQLDSPEFLQSLHQNLPQNIRSYNTSTCYQENWQRYSIKQHKKLPFDGILGQLSYHITDDSKADVIPWLVVGQLLQIGGKTTFGLGDYTLIS